MSKKGEILFNLCVYKVLVISKLKFDGNVLGWEEHLIPCPFIQVTS